jgi:Spy/CpxP family protein refolding chaperone
MNKRFITGLAIAGSLALAAPIAAQAWGGGDRSGHGRHAGAMHKHGHHGHHGDWQKGGQRMMRGLDLSDEQRGKLAELRKAQAQAMGEQMKTTREARRELHKLGFSADYDEAKVRQLSERIAQATGTMVALRTKGAHDFFQVLTPEQRQKFAERMARFEERRDRREGREGRRGQEGKPAAPAPRS